MKYSWQPIGNFSLALLVLTVFCCHTMKALSVNSRMPKTAAKYKEEYDHSRSIFVAGIPKECTEEDLRDSFAEFGTVVRISIIENTKQKPYAFVSFQDEESVRLAIKASSSSSSRSSKTAAAGTKRLLFTEVKTANKIKTQRLRSTQAKILSKAERENTQILCNRSNLLLQVQSTHADRLANYVTTISNNHRRPPPRGEGEGVAGSGKNVQVHGVLKTECKNLSLLLVSAPDPIEFSRLLCADPVLARALKRPYIVQREKGTIAGTMTTQEGCDKLAKAALDNFFAIECNNKSHPNQIEEGGPGADKEEEGQKNVLRVQVFPPKRQARFLQSMANILVQDPMMHKSVTIAPKSFTHMLSIVQVYRYKGRGNDESLEELFMFGSTPASSGFDVINTNEKAVEEGQDVNRAYYKLKEAFDRYAIEHSGTDFSLDDFHHSVALDCGSSPGGWTKYLIEDLKCQTVYSVDPGLLSPTVLHLEGTVYMQMKIQDALLQLLQQGEKGRVRIWVSDMCLHRMEEQVELLLLAKSKGLLAPNAFFVLTLKCLVGRSKQSFDNQVSEVVERLLANATDNTHGVVTYHLFSNRSGERTVMGFLK